jgi:hypothetical protein
VTGDAGRAGLPMLNMAMAAPPHASAPESGPFSRVAVFVGPKPGWDGPVLAAKDAEPEATSPVSAFAADKEAAKPEESAKAAIRSSVKPVARLRSLRAGHLTPEARARVVAAAHRVAAKKSQRP